MNSTSPPRQPPGPAEQRAARRLIVEVKDARDLLPKDGQGSSSPYVVVDFDGQRKRTSTKYRELNPTWDESLDFFVSDPNTMDYEELNVEVYHDKKMSPPGAARKNNFLGRVKIYGSQFSRRGEEGLVYFPLEKKSVFSWIRGEIGLRIYYFDDMMMMDEQQQPQPPQDGGAPPPEMADQPPEQPQQEGPTPNEVVMDAVGIPHGSQPPMVVIEEAPPSHPPQQPGMTETVVYHNDPGPPPPDHHQQQHYPPPYAHEMHAPPPPPRRMMRRPSSSHSEYAPKVISGNFPSEKEKLSAFDLVEPMQYLFVRIIKARGLGPNESSYVKIRTSAHMTRSKPASFRPGDSPENPEWNQVFALAHNKADTSGSTLEISTWDAPSEKFLGGVCFDLSDVPVRDPPDSPLAPQWYRLEGGASGDDPNNRVTGDIQLAVWIGTQADRKSVV